MIQAVGTPTNVTYLTGDGTWSPNGTLLYDFGQINLAADNAVQLLLEMSAVDFNRTSLGLNAGSII
jgi:hypothetical protein